MASAPENIPSSKTTLKLEVDGMSCEHCVSSLYNAIAALPGVVACRVRLGHAEVDIERDRCTLADITAAVQNAGPFTLLGFTRSD